jgi:carboxyl-terminal processing protease
MTGRFLARILIVFLIPAFAGQVAVTVAGFTAEQRANNLESFEMVWTIIRDQHYDPDLLGLDWDAIGRAYRPQVESATDIDQVRTVLTRMIGELNQSHFNLLPQEIFRDIDGTGQVQFLAGTTGIRVRYVDGRSLVVSVTDGSSADIAGVRAGWEVYKVGGEEIRPILKRITEEFREHTYQEMYQSVVVQNRLEGAVGDRVAVTFLNREETPVTVTLPLSQKPGWRSQAGNLPPVYLEFQSRMLPGNIGYISFSNFMDPVRLMPAWNRAMESFLDADGLLIDIRGNGGGMAPIAMGMAGWLVPGKEQYLGTVFMRNMELKTIIYPRPKTFDGPVAVLVDGLSASCSELFSGGLKDLGRARIVGTTTAGAVLMSTVQELRNGDALQYAFADFVSRGGETLEGRGVVPHETVRHTRQALLQGRDLPLERAIDWILEQKKY